MTVTRSDIEQHVIRATIGQEFDEQVIEAVTDEVLAVAPLSTWTLRELQFVSESMDEETYWRIVERVGTSLS